MSRTGGRGPAPKAERSRSRDTAERMVLPHTGPVGTPELPDADRFGARTLAWYDTWRTSPQASQFTATDWLRLHMLAPLVDSYFARPNTKVLAEVRLNEAKLGATPEDRLRLRWDIVAMERSLAEEPARPSRSTRTDPRLKLVEGGA